MTSQRASVQNAVRFLNSVEIKMDFSQFSETHTIVCICVFTEVMYSKRIDCRAKLQKMRVKQLQMLLFGSKIYIYRNTVYIFYQDLLHLLIANLR